MAETQEQTHITTAPEYVMDTVEQTAEVSGSVVVVLEDRLLVSGYANYGDVRAPATFHRTGAEYSAKSHHDHPHAASQYFLETDVDMAVPGVVEQVAHTWLPNPEVIPSEKIHHA